MSNLNTFTPEVTDRSGKRRLANKQACLFDLKRELEELFNIYYSALRDMQVKLQDIPVHTRAKNLEASMLQTLFAKNLFDVFKNNSSYGKYRRIILSINGYIILFKKLNKKGFPMNISTVSVSMINNQSQQYNLFNEDDTQGPILYFGYQRDHLGAYKNPHLLYIDDNRVQFRIIEKEIGYQLPIFEIEPTETVVVVKPKIKEAVRPKIRKAE